MLITRDSQESKAQGDEGQTRAGKRRDAQQGAQQAWNICTLFDRPYREHLYCMVDKELNNKTQSLDVSFRERQEVCRKTKNVEQRMIKGNPAHVDFGQQETLTR